MKKSIIFSSSLLLIIGIFGIRHFFGNRPTASATSNATYHTYTNTEYGYSFVYADGLILSSGSGVGFAGDTTYPFTEISDKSANVFVHDTGANGLDELVFALLADQNAVQPYTLTTLSGNQDIVPKPVPTMIAGFAGFQSGDENSVVQKYYFDTLTSQYRLELLSHTSGSSIAESLQFQ